MKAVWDDVAEFIALAIIVGALTLPALTIHRMERLTVSPGGGVVFVSR